MNRQHRTMTSVVVAAVALVACGGGDEASSDTTLPSATTTQPTPAEPTSESGGAGTTTPVASNDVAPTIAPGIPEEFLPGVGPIAVEGEALPQFPDGGDDPALGMTAPVLIGETFDGVPVRIDATVDGPTWIVFLAHWCPHCNDEIPVINELRDDGRIPDGVNVVGLSTAYTPARPNWPPGEWLVDTDWTYTAIPDGIDMASESYIAASAFGIGGFPFSVLIDGDGTVVARWSGGRGADDLVSLLTTNLSPT